MKSFAVPVLFFLVASCPTAYADSVACPMSLEDLRAKTLDAGPFEVFEDIKYFESGKLSDRFLVITDFAPPDRMKKTKKNHFGIIDQYIVVGEKSWKAGPEGKWAKAGSQVAAGFMALLPFYPSADPKDLTCVDSPSGKNLDWSWAVENHGQLDHYVAETDKQTNLVGAVNWEHHVDQEHYSISHLLIAFGPKIKVEAPKP